MNKISKMFALTVIIALLCSTLIPLNTQAQTDGAGKPEWSVGDEWSMGYEKDLNNLFNPGLEEINNTMDNEEEIKNIDYNIDGKVGFYQIYKIKSESDSTYTMDIKAGGGFGVKGDASITAEFVEEGKHVYNFSDEAPKTEKTISGKVDMGYSVDIRGTANFTKDNLAVTDAQLKITMKGYGDFKINNFPAKSDTDYYYENDTIVKTMNYKDYNGKINGSVTANLNFEFEPALDIFQFPIETGTTWDVESEATLSGTYSGRIETHGLPEEAETYLGIEKEEFPFILEEQDTGEDDIHDGIIEKNTDTMEFKMSCIDTEEIVLEDGKTTNTYVLKGGELYDHSTESMNMHFSPEEGFIVSERFKSTNSEMSNYMGSDEVDMEPVSEDKAKKSIETFEAESEKGDDSDSSFLDLLFGPPYIYMLVAAIAIIVIAAVVVGRKGKKENQYQGYQYDQQPPSGQQPPQQQQPPQNQQNRQQPPQQQGRQYQPQNQQQPPQNQKKQSDNHYEEDESYY